ncbi:hypothetical protein [Clostridium cylindrosporum]|uniref:Uncharacterized protein n=1 Tax=Clostridium cylindrosporum DSM 605 TaxID=1121307 RepID=A0A0J8DFM0_CLOCY|nr:hypothetical protein [Clostridium cylindrosporum]KMT23019.1 hypothetical protein CLCY_7c00660 [Clostridium cylindrosporum DSM 605]
MAIGKVNVGGGNSKLIKTYYGLIAPTSPKPYDIWVKIDTPIKQTLFRNSIPTSVKDDTLILTTVQNTNGTGVRYNMEVTGGKLSIIQQVVYAVLRKNGVWVYPEVRVYIDNTWKYLSGVNPQSAERNIYEAKNIDTSGWQFYKTKFGTTNHTRVSDPTKPLAMYSSQKLVRHPSGFLYSSYTKTLANYGISKVDEVTGEMLWEKFPSGIASHFVLAMRTDREGNLFYGFYTSSTTPKAFRIVDGVTGVDLYSALVNDVPTERIDLYKSERLATVYVYSGNSAKMFNISWSNGTPTLTLVAQFTSMLISGNTRYPISVKFDRNGNVYVLYQTGRLYKWDGVNTGNAGLTLVYDCNNNNANHLLIDGNGHFYIHGSTTISQYISKLDENYNLIYTSTDLKFNSYQTPKGGSSTLETDNTFIIDTENNLYIKNSIDGKIYLFDRVGTLVSEHLDITKNEPFTLEMAQMTTFPEYYTVNK